MFKRFIICAAALVLVLVLCSVLIAPSVDLEPGTLRSLQFVVAFSFLLCWLVFSVAATLRTLVLPHTENPQIEDPVLLIAPSADVSCILLC
jgi:thiosulfate reductase cytochrome b subunit